jgi:hypothetical protein
MCSIGNFVGVADLPEGISGWRDWKLELASDGTPILRSLVNDTRWQGRRLTADAPPTGSERDRHGIYAYLDPRPVGHVWRREHAVVSGEVILSGRIALHERGVRAEHAAIRRLKLDPCGLHGPDSVFCRCTHGMWLSPAELDHVRASLAQRYGCPVEITAERSSRRGRDVRPVRAGQLDMFTPALPTGRWSRPRRALETAFGRSEPAEPTHGPAWRLTGSATRSPGTRAQVGARRGF